MNILGEKIFCEDQVLCLVHGAEVNSSEAVRVHTLPLEKN